MSRFWTNVRAAQSDISGSMAIYFALALIPICGVIGLAVDHSRAEHARSQLQAATDSAALAAGGLSGRSIQEIRPTVLSVFTDNAHDLGHLQISDDDINLSLQDDQLIVNVGGTLSTTFATLFGIDSWDINVTSAVIAGSNDMELALVLDNTGSMSPFMEELRQGTGDLVEMLFDRSSASRLKIAVVPYVGGVNIGNGSAQRDWMDLNAEAAWHAAGLEYKSIGRELGCTSGPGDPITDPGTGTQGSIWHYTPSFAWLAKGLFGTPAKAASPGDVPPPFGFVAPCEIQSPGQLNTFDFLDQMTNTSWKGCVEARAEPHDVTDTAPSSLDPDTLFVPWFWPDEVDQGPMAAAVPGYVTINDYIPDRLDRRNAIAPVFNDQWPMWGWANILKYESATANIVEVGPNTLGPNKSCPDPLLPLTNDKAQVMSKIDDMIHWNDSGTNMAEGLAWGWRVLSPTEPFTEGAPYGEANKVIVLMTDGQNNIDPHLMSPVLSHYSAYGFLEQWGESRLTDKSFAGFKAHTDQRFSEVCQNAKAEGITIYTVAFGVTDQSTLNLLRSCATAPPLAFTAATAAELVSSFRNIASRISQLRLSK